MGRVAELAEGGRLGCGAEITAAVAAHRTSATHTSAEVAQRSSAPTSNATTRSNAIDSADTGHYTWKFDNYTHAHPPYDVTAEDTEALWRDVFCPILFVNAKQGYPHRIGQDDTLQHFRDAAVVSLDDAGHWVHHDRLDVFMGAAERFLAN